MIESLGERHVKAVAALHCATLTGLLSQLGKLAAEAYYAGCVRTNLAVGLVYLDGGHLRGFVLGSPHPDRLRKDVLRMNLAQTVLSLGVAALRRPASIMSLIESFRGRPDKGSVDARAPELIYLAVAPNSRDGGVGKKLVEAFTERMRSAGVKAYELSVDDDNATAVAFYERRGFRLIGRYHQFGLDHRRYRLVVA